MLENRRYWEYIGNIGLNQSYIVGIAARYRRSVAGSCQDFPKLLSVGLLRKIGSEIREVK